MEMQAPLAAAFLVGAFLVGAIPFAYLTARLLAGVDLRRVGTGTVSGTGVGETVGFWPMAASGVLDITKGILAVVFLYESHPMLAACCAGAAAIGHNWSPFLRGAGGRALSVALGVTLVMAWPGLLVLAFGMGVFRIFRQTGLGSFLAQVALLPVLVLTAGWPLASGWPTTVQDPAVGAVLGAALVLPMWAKRLLGNDPGRRHRPAVYLSRLIFDNDISWPVRGGTSPEVGS
jgi:acyl phosphate:glycerol-3-phosphate acyltransferase